MISRRPTPRTARRLHDDLHRSWSAVAVKGAPDVVLRLCTRIQTMDDQVRLLDERMRQEILAANDSMTKDALRVLGLAYRLTPAAPDEVQPVEMEQELIFAGLDRHDRPARGAR